MFCYTTAGRVTAFDLAPEVRDKTAVCPDGGARGERLYGGLSGTFEAELCSITQEVYSMKTQPQNLVPTLPTVHL